MIQDILNPLQEYSEVFRQRFKEVAEKTFDELVEEAHIDVEANRQTCSQVYAAEKECDTVKTSIKRWIVLCIILWIVVVGGTIAIIATLKQLDVRDLIAIGLCVIASLCFLLLKAHPKMKILKEKQKQLTKLIPVLTQQAWEQMSPLNRLYDWDVFCRMITKTVPRLEFDPYFTVQRLADLQQSYGWDGSFNEDRSVMFSHSGLINGNPFVICQTKKMKMGTKCYEGSKEISWTTLERDANGNTHTVTHYETLYATVTAPFPNYFKKTRLIYANTAAPDLTFNRKKSGLANKEGSLSYKWQRHKLRKKAMDLEHADYAMMTNEDFEVAFDTRNRNNNQQFALLFTPLAQENMLNILRDNEVGYGDDFNFDKLKMINIITPDHLQGDDLDMNPKQYLHFDFEKAKQNFYSINENHFRAIYFALAPLLCIPMYQQIRPPQDIYGIDMARHSSFWEHEAIANFWGKEHFQHPSCVTDCILKTNTAGESDNSTITVTAYGYRSEERLTYVSKLGGDGIIHDVPVYWDEYLPVTGTGSLQIREDNNFDDSQLKQKERLEHISKVLNDNNCEVYRRHIASRI
ncbi:MAG: hypothetical protein MJZ76_03190 [Bacteroidales bacterium]|nr:hypothetical protein [Bacteroidales bacterium]